MPPDIKVEYSGHFKVNGRGMKNLREIALQTHTCLYSKDTTHQRNAIRSHYSTKAVFNDPLVHAQGWRDIEAQFKGFQYFTSVVVSNVKVYECNYVDRDTVMIEATVNYRLLWIFKISIQSISKFEFDSSGRITSHTDIWSIMDLLAGIFVFGWIYGIFRRGIGAFVAAVFSS